MRHVIKHEGQKIAAVQREEVGSYLWVRNQMGSCLLTKLWMLKDNKAVLPRARGKLLPTKNSILSHTLRI